MDYGILSKHLAEPVGTIVHFGAGRCTELEIYSRMGPESLILVDAVPEQIAELKRRVAGIGQAKVRDAAVSDSRGKRTLKVMSLAYCSSLREPVGLRDLFPGISVIREVTVDTVLPQDVLAEQELDLDKGNLLVIDTPGEELLVLKELEASGSLTFFEMVHLRSGKSPLYESAVAGGALVDFQMQCGYEVCEADDPDRPQWLLKTNPASRVVSCVGTVSVSSPILHFSSS